MVYQRNRVKSSDGIITCPQKLQQHIEPFKLVNYDKFRTHASTTRLHITLWKTLQKTMIINMKKIPTFCVVYNLNI